MNLIFKTPPSCPAAHYDGIFAKGRGRKGCSSHQDDDWYSSQIKIKNDIGCKTEAKMKYKPGSAHYGAFSS